MIEVDEGWFGDWSADERFPVTDELLVFIHGWFGDATVRSQASTLERSLESGGYSPDETAAIQWPATTLDSAGAESDTEDVGAVTATLTEEFYDAGGGAVRLVGHSLGGRCAYWTLTELSSGYEIETVAGLGTAGYSREICGGPFEAGLDNACAVRNYHSRNDPVPEYFYGGYGDTALGHDGADCDPSSNYTDVDVSGGVFSHLSYLDDDAVGTDLAGAITTGSCTD
ncbi:alpha/beta hydrolase [Natrinema halophilum]|uniref:esterase/lipase family protein n=1 Tax=Natrinema halophilum TaxID=1699371 RepID=UPI0031BB114B